MLSDDDIELVKSLIAVLNPFETAIKKFEAEKVPTIQHVYPQYLNLKKATAPKEGDCEVISRLKARLRWQLEEKLHKNITLRHKMGAFFWPKFASLNILSDEDKAEVSCALFHNGEHTEKNIVVNLR